MWSHPFLIKDDSGEEVAVILLDSQGAFDSQSTMRDCASIFALSTLVSSLQIFNISQNIQECDLNHLRLFTEFAKIAKESNDDDHSAFQSLMFLIRDWYNADEYEYGFRGGKEYLANVLKTSSSQSEELRAVRRELRESFDALICFLMPFPGQRIASGAKGERRLGSVEEDFREHLKSFVPALFARELHAKHVGGVPIRARDLTRFFKSYTDILGDEKTPSPKTILQATIDAVCLAAIDNGRSAYEKKMTNIEQTASFTEFDKAHESAKAIAVASFNAMAKMGSEDDIRTHRNKLNSTIAARYEERKAIVEEREALARRKAEQERLERERAEKLRQEQDRLRREAEAQERERTRLRLERDAAEKRRREQEAEMARKKEEQEKEMARKKLGQEKEMARKKADMEREQERLHREEQDRAERRRLQAAEKAERQRARKMQQDAEMAAAKQPTEVSSNMLWQFQLLLI